MHASAKVPTSVRFSYYHAKLTVWSLMLLPYNRALAIGAAHFQETVPPGEGKCDYEFGEVPCRGEAQVTWEWNMTVVRGTCRLGWSVEYPLETGLKPALKPAVTMKKFLKPEKIKRFITLPLIKFFFSSGFKNFAVVTPSFKAGFKPV